MSKEIKFTDEELKSLTDLQNKYQDSQIKFGQISVQRLLLNQQLDKLFENEQKKIQGRSWRTYGPSNRQMNGKKHETILAYITQIISTYL